MSSPPSEDPLATFNFLSDFQPAINFGEGFQFDQTFNLIILVWAMVVCCITMAHTMTIPAHSLLRAVCAATAATAAIDASIAVLIANTKGKAFCHQVGIVFFSGLV